MRGRTTPDSVRATMLHSPNRIDQQVGCRPPVTTPGSAADPTTASRADFRQKLRIEGFAGIGQRADANSGRPGVRLVPSVIQSG